MNDTPTNNFAVLNPLRVNTATLSNANLTASLGNAATKVLSSFGMTTGKWYWEYVYSSLAGDGSCGIATESSPTNTHIGLDTQSWGYVAGVGNKVTNSTSTAYGTAYGTSVIIGVCFDADLGTLEFRRADVSQGIAFTGLTNGPYFPAFGDNAAGASSTLDANFGQRPFAYTPPTGFKSLCTANLPTPAIADPSKHFDVVLATGANIKTTAEAVFPGNFLEGIKDRGNSNNHQLIDTVRGTNAVLQSNTTAAETTYVAPSGSSVGWVWKAGGAQVSNTAGSITSQVSANVDAGFSIVTWMGF
jgi:hypothetical protein